MLHDFGQYAARTQHALVCRFGEPETDAIVAEARYEFERLIPLIPYIGGLANPLTWNLESSAIYLSLFRVLQRRGLSLEGIGEIVNEAVEHWLRRYPAGLLRLIGWWHFTPWYLRSVRRRAHRS